MAHVPTRYSAPQRALHWLTVLLVFSTLPAGWIMVQEGLPRPVQDALFLYHKNIGPVILLLVVARLVLRLLRPAPPLPSSLSRMQALAAGAVHLLLYAALVAMAVSGILRVKAGGYPIELWDPLVGTLISKNEALAKAAQGFHGTVWIVLAALIAAHVGAAALHGLIRKDGVFSRMWPPA